MKKCIVRAIGDVVPESIANTSERHVVYWNDDGGVLVAPFPDVDDVGAQFPYSGLDAYLNIRRASTIDRVRYLMDLMVKLIVEYGCNPSRVTGEFMKIPEYKNFMDGFSMVWDKARK